MKKNILIFGAGGHGKVVLDILQEQQNRILGFIDDNHRNHGKNVNGFKVLGDFSYLEKIDKESKVALGIGDNKLREKIYKKIKELKREVICAIHPRATVARTVKVGEGVVIMAGAVVNPNVVLEEGVVINTGATVDHDCHLKRFSHVWPGAHLAGSTEVGAYSYVGIGADVIQNIKIGREVIIGAGAVVISDIPDFSTAVGIPARVIKTGEK